MKGAHWVGLGLGRDPFFIEKVRDIVGLYLNPPGRALVLCVDEKSRGSLPAPSRADALLRTQPMTPSRPPPCKRRGVGAEGSGAAAWVPRGSSTPRPRDAHGGGPASDRPSRPRDR
jgi:hypothetical protein